MWHDPSLMALPLISRVFCYSVVEHLDKEPEGLGLDPLCQAHSIPVWLTELLVNLPGVKSITVYWHQKISYFFRAFSWCWWILPQSWLGVVGQMVSGESSFFLDVFCLDLPSSGGWLLSPLLFLFNLGRLENSQTFTKSNKLACGWNDWCQYNMIYV